MQPSGAESSLQIAEKLLVLTHALGEAAGRADNAEIGALFSERSKLLRLLEAAESNPALLEVLRKIQAAEVEALGRFQQSKAFAVRDMEKGLHGKKVHGTYATKGGMRSFDVNG